MDSKSELRKRLRKARREHVAAQSSAIKALLFNRPPAPLLGHISPDAVIGLYHATADEAPTSGYAGFFHEAGHLIALPHFTSTDDPMTFRVHSDPFAESDLQPGPYGVHQAHSDAIAAMPDILFVPLIGFTADLARLGQGGGHYDRWLTTHSGRKAIGLAWDVQLVEELPIEPHDIGLDAVVTPTRIYGLD